MEAIFKYLKVLYCNCMKENHAPIDTRNVSVSKKHRPKGVNKVPSIPRLYLSAPPYLYNCRFCPTLQIYPSLCLCTLWVFS